MQRVDNRRCGICLCICSFNIQYQFIFVSFLVPMICHIPAGSNEDYKQLCLLWNYFAMHANLLQSNELDSLTICVDKIWIHFYHILITGIEDFDYFFVKDVTKNSLVFNSVL